MIFDQLVEHTNKKSHMTQVASYLRSTEGQKSHPEHATEIQQAAENALLCEVMTYSCNHPS